MSGFMDSLGNSEFASTDHDSFINELERELFILRYFFLRNMQSNAEIFNSVLSPYLLIAFTCFGHIFTMRKAKVLYFETIFLFNLKIHEILFMFRRTSISSCFSSRNIPPKKDSQEECLICVFRAHQNLWWVNSRRRIIFMILYQNQIEFFWFLNSCCESFLRAFCFVLFSQLASV